MMKLMLIYIAILTLMYHYHQNAHCSIVVNNGGGGGGKDSIINHIEIERTKKNHIFFTSQLTLTPFQII